MNGPARVVPRRKVQAQLLELNQDPQPWFVRPPDFDEALKKLSRETLPRDYSNEAELFALHGLSVPTNKKAPGHKKVRCKRAAHRPTAASSRTWDAACLYREFRRLGMKSRVATDALHTLLGVSKGNVLNYQRHAVATLNEEHDRRIALSIFADYWPGLFRLQWHKLTPAARTALWPVVSYSLFARYPPPDPS